ncbi:hypothetical protein JOF48_002113 [Arthrobacter stackebrandtii]|uniref:DUF3592 domain-containing protein n=1 Tax=Arthrobacter stackebrandtii TaxID=272161 RepID=A0ABS4YX67_9MICC|nr:hypothetical protein [Arthrobacter stackebrandtii]MBP2413314.1 hypothetical protein [Arthrobacter stackebrandtii]PYG99592.1 hypothetical protein CVV67_14765 [Arthrobacter stackebrandtii]
MTQPRPALPATTLRTASIVILLFAAMLLLFGYSTFRAGNSDASTAQELQSSGLPGIVNDAKVNVGRGSSRQWHASHVELTFTGTDGSQHTMQTDHFPHFTPPVDSTAGWFSDFPTKNEIVGQPVLYRLGESPAVELSSEIPALASTGWSFPNYLGLAIMAMGAAAAIGGSVSLVRSVRRLRAGKPLG